MANVSGGGGLDNTGDSGTDASGNYVPITPPLVKAAQDKKAGKKLTPVESAKQAEKDANLTGSSILSWLGINTAQVGWYILGIIMMILGIIIMARNVIGDVPGIGTVAMIAKKVA